MRVAILGNMNNNGFSLLRYFRDLGVDAHLFPFSNDGKGSLAHFSPEADTWDIGRWGQFIHSLDIVNGWSAVIGMPKKMKLPPSAEPIRRALKPYTHIVGTGIAPALVERIGRRLDIFFPYATGVEYVGTWEDRKLAERRASPRALISRYVRRKQIRGLRRACCLNAEMSLTKQTFDDLAIPFLPVAVPMIYNRESFPDGSISDTVSAALDQIGQHDFVVFSHARLVWVRPPQFSESEWGSASKHNEWLVQGYAEFLRQQTYAKRPLLVLLEYGPDVERTQQLCSSLGLEKQVLWLPKMLRKEIMLIMAACDVGVGEFHTEERAIWGGTGWEVLASGKPLLQGFRFREGEFEKLFGHEPPPLMGVSGPGCVTRHLLRASSNPDEAHAMGDQAVQWFNKHNGIGLAKKWVEILLSPSGKKAAIGQPNPSQKPNI